jgi:hypothetical protein
MTFPLKKLGRLSPRSTSMLYLESVLGLGIINPSQKEHTAIKHNARRVTKSRRKAEAYPLPYT